MRRVHAVLLATLLLAAAAAWSGTLPQPGSDAWRPVAFSRREAPTHYEVRHVDGQRAWRATSACSASGMFVTLDDVDLSRTPLLSWSWRVVRIPTSADERARSGDDFAARVYVVFPKESEDSSLWGRALRRMGEALTPGPVPGFTVSYVWASTTPRGTRWASPYSDRARMVAQRSGPAGASLWHPETVDVAADVPQALGPRRTMPVAVAIMTDSDDTCTRAEAWYRGFRFRSRPVDGQPERKPRS